jgi:RNA polymerase sigma-70 factor, ECF subfamily
MPEAPGDITLLLHRWSEGSREAENELFALVLPNLKGLARYFMQKERPDHSLQATELIDTVYFRLVAARNRDWQNRKHFFAIAARAMRRYLIDHARGRPHADVLPLDDLEQFLPAQTGKLHLAITVDRLLDDLAKLEPEWCMVVEMKYFLGLTDDEAAEAMNVKLRTMQRMWRDSRQWLFTRMESGNAQNAG